jgi:hypothetical protein
MKLIHCNEGKMPRTAALKKKLLRRIKEKKN